MLKQLGHGWRDVPGNKELCSQLALIDHSYHAFASQPSVFAELERVGVLEHRVGTATPPGCESEPYVPDTITRARPRAQFIKEYSGVGTMMLDWSGVHDLERRRYRELDDPFASEFGPWQGQRAAGDDLAYRGIRRLTGELRALNRPPAHDMLERLASVFAAYESGRYHDAREMLDSLEALGAEELPAARQNYLRYRAFVETRRGMLNGTTYLDRLRSREGLDISLATDYMLVARFSGLAPRPDLAAWATRGLALLPSDPAAPFPPAVHEHHAAWLLVEGRLAAARDVLEQLRANATWTGNLRIQGRVLGMLAEIYRQFGEPARALAALDEAEELQRANGYEGDLADFTWLARAKLVPGQRKVRSLLRQARWVQTSMGNPMGSARSLLLGARLLPPRYRFTAERRRQQVLKLAASVPALAECRLVRRITARWADWISGAVPSGERDCFWGL